MRMRILRDERGFTLPEVLVTMLLMVVVLFALQNVFDASIRVFKFGNDKTEAVENARLGLERMERELRGAHPYDLSNNNVIPPVPPNTTDDFLFFDASVVGAVPAVVTSLSPNQITFGNDLGAAGAADQKLSCGTPCEYITYKLRSTANAANDCTATAAPCSLRRVNSATGSSNVSGSNAGDAVVDYVAPGGLTFEYLNDSNNPVTVEQDVRKVRMTLRVDTNGRTQTLTTDVDLRNRGG